MIKQLAYNILQSFTAEHTSCMFTYHFIYLPISWNIYSASSMMLSSFRDNVTWMQHAVPVLEYNTRNAALICYTFIFASFLPCYYFYHPIFLSFYLQGSVDMAPNPYCQHELSKEENYKLEDRFGGHLKQQMEMNPKSSHIWWRQNKGNTQ